MILTVTANPALDLTYTLDHLRLGESNRVATPRRVAGGKGVNVASVLRRFGYDVEATGLLGGLTGQALRADLAARGIDPGHFVACGGETRRTVTVVADGAATLLNEAGPDVTAPEWALLADVVAARTADRDGPTVVVLSGSLPGGIGEDGYARLLAAAGPDVVSIVDVGGRPLVAACAAHPTLVKPNRAELSAATGRDDLLAGARDLRRHGALAVLVTDGPRGVVYVPDDGPALRARLDAPVAGNPTGAGDAFAAAMAAAAVDGRPAEEALRRGVAWAAAAVLAPVAGQVDPERAAALLPHVVVEECG